MTETRAPYHASNKFIEALTMQLWRWQYETLFLTYQDVAGMVEAARLAADAEPPVPNIRHSHSFDDGSVMIITAHGEQAERAFFEHVEDFLEAIVGG